MQKKIFIPLLYFFAFCFSSKAQSQVPQNGDVWDLQKCLAYATVNNITINSLRLSQQTSEQDVVLSKAAKYPNLYATASQSLAHTTTGWSPASGYGISSDVMLFNGGYYNNDIKQKQLSLQSAGLDVAIQENDITLQITEAYYNIALAQENIVYVKDLVATSEAQVKQGQQRFAAGSIAQKDLLQLQAVLANDEYNLVTAQNAEQQYLLTLKQILQLPTGQSLQITTPDTLSATASVTPLADVQQTALASRPEITNADLGIQIADVNLAKARVGLKPTISLGGIMNTNYANSSNYTYTKTLNNNFYQQVGVSLSIPIFDRKVTQTNVAKAKINIAQANLNLNNAKITLMQQIEQAYLNVINTQSQYRAAEEQLRYTQEAFRIANEQLRIGSYNIVDFLQQRNLYVQALQAYVQSKYSTALYSKIYNFYNGTPVTQ